MPNWCDNDLTITGPTESLDELVLQMKQPYQVIQQDYKTGEITMELTEGEFLLWNIIRPIDLDTYFKVDEMKALQDEKSIAHLDPTPPKPMTDEEAAQAISDTIAENLTKLDMSEVAEKFHKDLETKNDWYHWNIRNWGTKWEIEAEVARLEPGEVFITFQSAWSPPLEAIDKLAIQYPMLKFRMRFVEEGMDFAGEVEWENGERTEETDIEINHAFREEYYGECHCEWDDLDDEERAEMGCPPRDREDA